MTHELTFTALVLSLSLFFFSRGMLTLRTQASYPTEAAVVPRVCVWGRSGGSSTGPGARAAISPPGGELSAQALAWPSFHSGVAAGLALLPTNESTLDSTWLLFNKPKVSCCYVGGGILLFRYRRVIIIYSPLMKSYLLRH